MKNTLRVQRMVGALLLGAALAACTSNYPSRTVSYEETPVDRPAMPPGESELLAVRIEAFGAGAMPENPNVARGLSPEIRSAEAYYVPVQLKNTMQRSGHWGSVRVVPKGTRDGEVIVAGRILESDGEILRLGIEVRDATGDAWFAREYESVVDATAYRKAELDGVDVFQSLYNRIANDIAAHKRRLTSQDAVAIRQVAGLRFGAEFAPEAFDGYLRHAADPVPREEGLQRIIDWLKGAQEGARSPLYSVSRLPSQEDPVVQRVQRIRAREELLVDTLDQQYDGLARHIGGPYTQWRSARVKEINAIRAADNARNEEQAKAIAVGVIGILAGVAIAAQGNGNCYGCGSAGAAVAGAAVAISVQMAVEASRQASAETSMHKAALEELGQSLATDVKPTVVDVEGQTVELKGTIEEKFRQWREVLQELRESETRPALEPATAPTS